MSTNNDGWISISTRKPATADLPIWISDNGEVSGAYWTLTDCLDHVYWKPAAADIPAPPKDETQWCKDVAGYSQWVGSDSYFKSSNWSDVWRAALAYERAEVLKLLPPVRPLVNYSTGIPAALDAIEAIRARCGGAK